MKIMFGEEQFKGKEIREIAQIAGGREFLEKIKSRPVKEDQYKMLNLKRNKEIEEALKKVNGTIVNASSLPVNAPKTIENDGIMARSYAKQDQITDLLTKMYQEMIKQTDLLQTISQNSVKAEEWAG